MRSTVALAVLLSALGAQAAHSACVQNFTFHLSSEGPWPASGTVRSGEKCGGSYRAGGVMSFKRLFLVERPQHGSVGLIEGGRYTYQSTAHYVGADHFVLRVCGTEQNREGCANIRYDLTIAP